MIQTDRERDRERVEGVGEAEGRDARKVFFNVCINRFHNLCRQQLGK